MAAALDRQLLKFKLLVKLGNLSLKLGANILNGDTITSELDVLVISASGMEDGSLAGGGWDRRRSRTEVLVRRDSDLNTMRLLKCLGKRVTRAGKERVESSRDTTDFGLSSGRALVGNLENLVAGGSSRECIALNRDIDGSILVIIELFGIVGLGELNFGASLLLQGLDCRATLANDVSASGVGDRNFNDSLECMLAFAGSGRIAIMVLTRRPI